MSAADPTAEAIKAKLRGMKVLPLLDLAEALGLDVEQMVREAMNEAAGGAPIPPPGDPSWSAEMREELSARSTELVVDRVFAAWAAG